MTRENETTISFQGCTFDNETKIGLWREVNRLRALLGLAPAPPLQSPDAFVLGDDNGR